MWTDKEALQTAAGRQTVCEEAGWESLTRMEWRRTGEGQARGRWLVDKIQFPLMEKIIWSRVPRCVVGMAPASAWWRRCCGPSQRGKGHEPERLLGRKALAGSLRGAGCEMGIGRLGRATAESSY
jgi:hypothetical protein